jgi:hypothetical protein
MSKLNNTTDKELFDYAEILNVNINQIATKDNFKGSIKMVSTLPTWTGRRERAHIGLCFIV